MGGSLQKIHFTKSEIRVVVFLLLILLSGLLFKLTTNYLNPGKDTFFYKRVVNTAQFKTNPVSAGSTDSTEKSDTGYFAVKEKEIAEKNKALTDSLGGTKGKGSKKSSKEEKLKGKLININTAPKEDLVLLPGIGESTADKILLYRTEHGGFRKTEDIQKIKGIGKKKFEKLKPYITVN